MLKSSSSKIHLDNQCQECGCNCDSCVNNNSIHLHQEIESLKQRLVEREQQIVTMESQILTHANKYPNGEMQALRDNLYHWQDKYERLLENYRKLQKVNQGLEDKLLRVADRFENERTILTQNVADLTNELNETKNLISALKKESETYKNDYDYLVEFIINQSKATIINMDSLSQDFRDRLENHLEQKRLLKSPEPVRVPIPTFPPTAVHYSLNESSRKADRKKEPTPLPPSFITQILQTRKQAFNVCQNCNEKFNDSPELIPPSSNGDFIDKKFDSKTMII